MSKKYYSVFTLFLYYFVSVFELVIIHTHKKKYINDGDTLSIIYIFFLQCQTHCYNIEIYSLNSLRRVSVCRAV